MGQTVLYLITGLIGIIITFLVFNQPYIGIALTVASLPIVDLLPPIPFFSSVISLVGAITLVAYLIAKRKGPKGAVFKLNKLQITSLLFVMWIFVSNPQAALLGSSRNWVLTFFQLWVLLYLAGELLDSPQKQQTVMAFFSIASIISAFYALRTGVIGVSFSSSIRAEGFVDNANAAARYFTIAMVFLTYLRSIAKVRGIKILCLAGIMVTYLGVFYTVSRTGILLLFTAQGLILLLQKESGQRLSMVIIFLGGLLALWFLSDSIFDIIRSIIPTIAKGEDTLGLRYNLWKSGWLMWLDHPIQGVGIGRYIEEVGPYIWRMEGPRRWNSIAHNTYIQILSETGIVGFALFISLIVSAIKNFMNQYIEDDSGFLSLNKTWLITFIVILLGGITKSDHADKFTWMVIGLSVLFNKPITVEEEGLDIEEPMLRRPRKPQKQHSSY